MQITTYHKMSQTFFGRYMHQLPDPQIRWFVLDCINADVLQSRWSVGQIGLISKITKKNGIENGLKETFI